MRLYLAGPMGGIPRYNFPLFHSVTYELRRAGYEVVSPHEEDSEEVQAAAWVSEAGDFTDLPGMRQGDDETIRRNTEALLAVDGIALLDGWAHSLGARHEVAIAERRRIPVAPATLWMMVPSGAATLVYATDPDPWNVPAEVSLNGASMDPLLDARRNS